MTYEPAIDRFTGDHRFLSNFYPVDIEYEGLVYPSVEHAYQAAKSMFEDVRLRFADINLTAAQAKRLGQKIVLRDDWEKVKLDVMCDLIALKFARGSELASRLLATRNAVLIEGNTWNDTYWGQCKGKGHNHLGRILMVTRSVLRHPKGEPKNVC